MNIRIKSLDTFRGFALILIIFFHTSIYNFANIHKLDFSDPPLIVIVMSFMALWGGVFIFYSSFVNTYRSSFYEAKGNLKKQQRYLRIISLVYFIVHLFLVLIFGRWANDFVHNKPDMTLIAASIRQGRLVLPNLAILNEGSSVLIIAANLLVISYLLPYLVSVKQKKNYLRNIILLTIAGLLIMIFSNVRVLLHPSLDPTLGSQNLLLGILFSVFLANPYPMIPYLAYGLFGAVLGTLYARNDKKILIILTIILSVFFIAYGMMGIGNHEKTISTPDYFWYYKTQVELGLFILFIQVSLFLNKFRGFDIPIIGWFSRISLSIYLLETLLSELIRIPMLKILPGWNQTINGCLVFGAINVLLWVILVFIWKQFGFKYSLEYWWVKGLAKIGKESSKLALE